MDPDTWKGEERIRGPREKRREGKYFGFKPPPTKKLIEFKKGFSLTAV